MGDEIAFDVFTQADQHRVSVLHDLRSMQNVRKSDHFTIGVRHLNPHCRLAGDRGEQTHVVRRCRISQVGLQVRNLGYLDARPELNLIPRHCRPTRITGDLRIDLKLREGLRNRGNHPVIGFGPSLRRFARNEQIRTRQLIVMSRLR